MIELPIAQAQQPQPSVVNLHQQQVTLVIKLHVAQRAKALRKDCPCQVGAGEVQPRYISTSQKDLPQGKLCNVTPTQIAADVQQEIEQVAPGLTRCQWRERLQPLH